MPPSGSAGTFSVRDGSSPRSAHRGVDLVVLDADVEHRVARLEEAAAAQHLGHAQSAPRSASIELAGVLGVDDGDQKLGHTSPSQSAFALRARLLERSSSLPSSRPAPRHESHRRKAKDARAEDDADEVVEEAGDREPLEQRRGRRREQTSGSRHTQREPRRSTRTTAMIAASQRTPRHDEVEAAVERALGDGVRRSAQPPMRPTTIRPQHSSNGSARIP